MRMRVALPRTSSSRMALRSRQKFLGNKLLAATTDRAEGAKKAASAVLRGLETVFEAFGHKVQSRALADSARRTSLATPSTLRFLCSGALIWRR